MAAIIPRAPLPLSGFIRAVGNAPTKSESIPIASMARVMPAIKKSIAPEARNTAMATSIATK